MDHRWALLIFFLAYFFATFLWRSWQVWKQTGANPYVLPSGDDAQGYTARAFRGVLMTLFAYVAAQAVWPDIDTLLGPIKLPQPHWLAVAGWILLLAALIWIVIAQAQMGSSWRIGIDRTRRTSLVQTGLFSISRNPVFLAMRVSLYGLLLLRPNGLTLALAVAGELLMQLQVRQEEDFLLQTHGPDYRDYCERTPRWL